MIKAAISKQKLYLVNRNDMFMMKRSPKIHHPLFNEVLPVRFAKQISVIAFKIFNSSNVYHSWLKF